MVQAHSISLLYIWFYKAVLPGQQGRSGVSAQIKVQRRKGETEKEDLLKKGPGKDEQNKRNEQNNRGQNKTWTE